jgi:hypothetical protein
MPLEAFPSNEFWRNLGIIPNATLGRLTRLDQVKALGRWTNDDLRIAANITDEIPALPTKGSARMLALIIARRAPKATSLLILIRRFSELTKRSAVKGVALENGFTEPLPTRPRLILLLFQKTPDLLKRVQYRALAKAGSPTYPYVSMKPVDRRKIASLLFRKRLDAELSRALDSEGARRAEVDYVDAKRGEDTVTFSVRYEQKPKRAEQWEEVHYDKLVKRALLRVNARDRRLEVISRQGRNKDVFAGALSKSLWDDPSGFSPESDSGLSEMAGEEQTSAAPVEIIELTIRAVDSDNVDLDGSPSMSLEAVDLGPTLSQLSEMGIDLKSKVAAWRLRIRYTHADATSETVVARARSTNRIQFNPEPPYPVRMEIYRRLRGGLTELSLQ